MKRLLLIALIALACVGLAAGETVATPDSVVALPKLVDLGAGSCVPCKMMTPVLEELTQELEGQVEIVFIDVKENRAEAQKYRIRVIPTQIYYSAAGEELWRHEGYMARGDIVERMRELDMIGGE